MYKTWLIVGDKQPKIDDPVLRIMEDLGLFKSSKHELNSRVSVFLWLNNNVPRIGFETSGDCDKIFKELNKVGSREKVITAFACLPLEALKRVDGKVFNRNNLSISITCTGADDFYGEDNVYYRRFVNIQYKKYDLNAGVEASIGEGVNTNEYSRLYLEPSLLEIDTEEHLNALHGVCTREKSDVMLLPPWRLRFWKDDDKSYFNRKSSAVRRQMQQKMIRSAAQPDDIPFGFTVWRLMDDPLFRDLLFEGGSMTIEKEDGKANEIVCHLNEHFAFEPILGAWRREYVSAAYKANYGPQWQPNLVRAVEGDYRSPLKNVNVQVDRSEILMDWNIVVPEVQQGPSPKKGMYQFMEHFKRECLGKLESVTFFETVLRPAIRGEQNPNHNLVEQNFIANFCRCPWTSETSLDEHTGKVWIDFFRDIVQSFMNLETVTRAGERFKEDNSIWLDNDATWKHTSLIPRDREYKISLWRLQLPSGVILKSANSNILDDENTKLNSGLVLG